MTHQIDFTAGHWRHARKKAELISSSGEVITRSVTSVPAALSMGVGDTFARRFPALFKGCGCKRDVVAVMNRWAVERTDEAKIETVARTIANKNANVTVEEVLNIIGEHLKAIVGEAIE
jgi:hypothetical protein